jgi:ethanolamine utilization cobalamin adenosyltransferase
MMTNNMKLALFRKALETLDAEIEKTECELANSITQKLIGSVERCLNELKVYDAARERIINVLDTRTGETE